MTDEPFTDDLIRTIPWTPPRPRRRLLRMFARVSRPAAWVLMLGGAVTFVSVAVGLVVVGDAKWATLLVSADLLVSGFTAVQNEEGDES